MRKKWAGTNQSTKITTRERFLEKILVNPVTGCWEWQAGLNSDGYGTFLYERKGSLAHRVSYKMYIGEIPEKLLVCHHCDNPPCVNPFHLFSGSHDDNLIDAQSKGRRRKEKHPSLTSYKKGCRCSECAEIQRVNHRLYDKAFKDKHRDRINARRREIKALKKLNAQRT